MKACRFTAPNAPLEIVDLPKPSLKQGEALVRVRAVGICGSDVHIIQGHTPVGFTPITLGHEISGTVEALGSPSKSPVEVGDHVFINPMIGCGQCRFCRDGEVNFCAKREILGIQRNGGLAEYVVAPIENLTVMPKHVGFDEIALIESAGTANHAVRVIDPDEDDSIVIIGTGGLGMQALRIALTRGASVIAVDTDPVSRQRSLDAGALAAIDPANGNTDAEIKRALSTHKEVKGAIDCVGNQATFTLALETVGMHGHVALIGIGDQPLSLTPPAHFMRRALRVSGIYGYTHQDIADVVARVSDGSLDLRASVSARLDLEEVNEAVDLFASRQGSPVRVIIDI